MTNNILKNSTLGILRSLDDSPIMRAIRAMEDSPTMRMIRDINDSPVLRVMHEIENSPSMQILRQLEESPAMRIMRDLENFPTLKIVEKLESSDAFKAIRELQDSPVLRAIKGLETSPSIKAFSRVTEQLNHNYGALAFSEAYDLLINEIQEAEDDASLAEKIQDKSTRSPLSLLSAEFYLSLIFALFLYYLSQMSAIESEERVLEKMNELEQTIATQLNVLQGADIDHEFLVTERELNFRKGPGMEYEVIEVLPRNKKVMELERNKEWIKIEFFDYINNISRVGWVHSGHLIAMNLMGEE